MNFPKSITCGFLLLFAVGCDYIDNPIENPDVPVDTNSVKQNVLLEDYTGHTCGNCPEAAEVAHQIQNTYGADRVIVVAVHAGPFAFVQQPDYPTDFQTTVGTDLDNTFRISRAGNPNGLVSRTSYSGKFIQGKDNWAPATVDLLDNKPLLQLSMNHTWDSATKTVNVNVDSKYLDDGTPDYYLVGWLVENDIIDDQTDYRETPSHIEDYEFDHVLRASFNGTWGDQLSATDVAKGTTISKTLSLTFPASATWVPKNCDVIIYVHRYGGATKEVVQVISAKLIP